VVFPLLQLLVFFVSFVVNASGFPRD